MPTRLTQGTPFAKCTVFSRENYTGLGVGLTMRNTDYDQAQLAISMLKSAIYNLLSENKEEGMRNVDVARKLGIRGGIGPHTDIQHRDWISKTVLCMMEREEVVQQVGTRWFLLE